MPLPRIPPACNCRTACHIAFDPHHGSCRFQTVPPVSQVTPFSNQWLPEPLRPTMAHYQHTRDLLLFPHTGQRFHTLLHLIYCIRSIHILQMLMLSYDLCKVHRMKQISRCIHHISCLALLPLPEIPCFNSPCAAGYRFSSPSQSVSHPNFTSFLSGRP